MQKTSFGGKVSKNSETLYSKRWKKVALLVLRSVGVVCRAKPNVPLVRWQKNKKMCVGQKLNLCLVSLSARFFCPFGLGSVVRYHCCQRPAAWRCGGNLVQKFNRSTIAQPCTSA